MREMKDSGVEWIGEIPVDWIVERLKYTYSLANVGESVDKDMYSADIEGVTFYTAGLKPVRTSYEKFPEWKYTRNTDLLLSRNGTPYVYLPMENAVYSDHIIRIAINGEFDRRFIRYCLQRSIESEIVETVSIATWSISLWKEQVLPMPKHAIQIKIADYLDAKCSKIDEIIAKQEQIIEKLKEYKLSVITEAVTKGVNPNAEMKDSGIIWFGKIPTDWECVISRFVFDAVSDINHYMPESVESGYPYLMIGDLKEKTSEIDFLTCKQVSETDFEELRVKMQSRRGDIIFARYATIGTVCYVDTDNDFLVSYACVTVRPTKEKLDGRYLFYYFKSAAFGEEIKQYINSNTQGNVGIEALYNAKITIPSLEEQKSIAEYLDGKCSQIVKTIKNRELMISRLQEYKKSLIYEVVTGKKEV